MSVIYDIESDTLTILFSETLVEESDQLKPGTILDFDTAGNLVSMEILNASASINTPSQMDYRVANQAA